MSWAFHASTHSWANWRAKGPCSGSEIFSMVMIMGDFAFVRWGEISNESIASCLELHRFDRVVWETRPGNLSD